MDYRVSYIIFIFECTLSILFYMYLASDSDLTMSINYNCSLTEDDNWNSTYSIKYSILCF